MQKQYKKVMLASGMVGTICASEEKLIFLKEDGVAFDLFHSDANITIIESVGYFFDKSSEEFVIDNRYDLLSESKKESYIQVPPDSFGAFLPSMASALDEIGVMENYFSTVISAALPYDDNHYNRIFTIKVPSLKVMLGPDSDVTCWIYKENKKNIIGKIDHCPATLGRPNKIDGSWEDSWELFTLK